MSNYLVTGGGGFIGSNIVEVLLDQGHAVRVLDNFATGKRENLAQFQGKIDLVEGDLRNPDDCRRACADMEYVLHQGAYPSVQRSVEEPAMTSETNVMGTINILDAAVKAKVRRFVYAASSSAYGDQPKPVKDESILPAPLSPYASAKLASEYFCQCFWHSMKLETVCLRYFNVFGPRQDPMSQYSAVIPLFVTAVIAGKRPTVYGDGMQTRDFTYVANNVQANILASTSKKAVAGQVINIACGTSYSLLDLLKAINETLGTDIKPVFEPARVGDVKHSLADIAKARELLGYDVGVGFEEGIRRTIAWYKENASAWAK